MNKLLLSLSLICLAFLFTGCEEKGPAEQAGENIDNAVENSKDAAEDMTDKAAEKLDDAGDKLQE